MADVLLKEGESLDDLQLNNLGIIQKNDGFRYGSDAVLLSNYVKVPPNARVLDLGTGTGIIPLLLSAKTKASHITGIEIQPDIAEMAKRSIALNHLEDKIEIVQGDFLNALEWFGSGSFDAVVTNPPYTKPRGGLINPNDTKAVSRHEIYCTLEQLIAVSSKLLKQYGRFFMIHRPERLVDIFCTMRENKIEPKSMRLVHGHKGKPATLVLIYGLKNGNSQVTVEQPLYVYAEDKNGTLQQEIKK
ncbi:MAG: tRNA1(Val) (adenine(37)-N6)-methyltransferase [Thermoclostridium sp.]|nr:tRNA1(Val) (adenine(37)-N6)-methyltransferase [Thermoclostridium sp.]